MKDLSYLNGNFSALQERMDEAIRTRGGGTVTLIAAVKYTDADHINYLHRELGVNDVGENRVQQLLERWDLLDHSGLRVHFIGNLQKNKVKYIIDKVCMIHSLASRSVAEEIQRQAEKHDVVMDVLVEINCGREENKGGVFPEEVEAFCRDLLRFSRIRLRGFMAITPKYEKKCEYLKVFQETSQQCIDIWQKKLHNIGRPVLSMGMSDSYEEAILAGADMIRVGRTLFASPQKEKDVTA